MIPAEQILLVAVLQFVLGLSGMLLRRDGITMVVSAAIMLNGVVVAFGAALNGSPNQEGAEAVVVILALVIMLLVSGLSVVYSFHRFRRVVLLEEQDRMKH
jgi:NADH:ubiquinone oxidoreductase subunit 11 or 4L (chain K)